MLPPWASMMFLAIERPRPAPEGPEGLGTRKNFSKDPGAEFWRDARAGVVDA